MIATIDTDINFMNVVSTKPFLEKNILWENLDSNRLCAGLIQFILLILVLVFFIILMTPANVLNDLNSIHKTLGKKNAISNLWKDLISLVQPYIVIITNALIPIVVDLSLNNFKGYLTRSDKDIAKMKRIVFFLMLNTLILPLVADSTAFELFGGFFDKVNKKGNEGINEIVNFPLLISSNLMS
jgi:hypothetical protein